MVKLVLGTQTMNLMQGSLDHLIIVFIYVVFGTVAIHLWTKSLPAGMFHELPISAYATPVVGWLEQYGGVLFWLKFGQ